MSDIVGQLVSLTGIDEDQAVALLEATNYKLEDAVELFFSSTNGDDNAGKPTAPTIRSAASPEVRAPDTIKTQQLIPSAFGGVIGRGLVPDGLLAPGLMTASTATASSSTNPFTRGVSKSSSKHQKRLAELYQPPDDITFKGTLSQARDACRAEKRWLLVNVQDNAEFGCHLLNRDVWRDESIRVVLSYSFVFWQPNADSSDGSNFLRLYETVTPAPMPLVAVLDPESGALLRKWTGPGGMDSETIMNRLMDFLDSNPKSFSGTVPPKPMPVDVLARRPSESGEVSSDAVSSSSRSLTTHVATDKLGGRGSSSREVVDISGQGDSPSLHAGAVGVGAKRIRPVDIDAGDDIVVKSGRREMTTARQTRPEEEIVDFSLGLPVNTLAEMAPVSMREPSQKTFKSQFKLPNNKKIAKEFDANVSLLDVYIIMAAEVSAAAEPSSRPRHFDLLCGFPIASLLRSCRSASQRAAEATEGPGSSRTCTHSDSEEPLACLLEALRDSPAAGLLAGQLVTVKTAM